MAWLVLLRSRPQSCFTIFGNPLAACLLARCCAPSLPASQPVPGPPCRVGRHRQAHTHAPVPTFPRLGLWVTDRKGWPGWEDGIGTYSHVSPPFFAPPCFLSSSLPGWSPPLARPISLPQITQPAHGRRQGTRPPSGLVHQGGDADVSPPVSVAWWLAHEGRWPPASPVFKRTWNLGHRPSHSKHLFHVTARLIPLLLVPSLFSRTCLFNSTIFPPSASFRATHQSNRASNLPRLISFTGV